MGQPELRADRSVDGNAQHPGRSQYLAHLHWNTAFRADDVNISLLDSNKLWAIQQWDGDAAGSGAETVGLLTYDGPVRLCRRRFHATGTAANSVQDGRYWYVNNIWNFLEWGTSGTPSPGTAQEFLTHQVTTPDGTKAHIDTSSVDEYWFAGAKSNYSNTLYAATCSIILGQI